MSFPHKWEYTLIKIMPKQYYVYILTNKPRGTLYIGITGNIAKRIYEHKNKIIDGFSKKYDLNKLVYCESCDDVNAAIAREKMLKKWNRIWKIELIEQLNPAWDDLSENGFPLSWE
jgi:putative endonuclease